MAFGKGKGGKGGKVGSKTKKAPLSRSVRAGLQVKLNIIKFTLLSFQ